MYKMNILTTTQLRSNLSEIVNTVKYEKKIIAIGRKNKKEVLIVPYPEINDQDLPITNINAQSGSFDFLKEEPNLYSLKDLKKQYV